MKKQLKNLWKIYLIHSIFIFNFNSIYLILNRSFLLHDTEVTALLYKPLGHCCTKHWREISPAKCGRPQPCGILVRVPPRMPRKRQRCVCLRDIYHNSRFRPHPESFQGPGPSRPLRSRPGSSSSTATG